MANPVTIQPSGKDTYLNQYAPTTNYGTAISFSVQSRTGYKYRAILSFDFSAVIPAGATITLATLSLYCTQGYVTRTITVYRLLCTDWVETEATWTIYKTGSNWGTAGALGSGVDFTPTDAATAVSAVGGQWLNETVTAQVQTALDSVAGVAHFLVADMGGSASNTMMYRPREYTTASLCPKLYIEYTLPPSTSLNISDAFKAIDFLGSKLNVGAAWKAVRTIKINIADAWRRVYSSPAVLNEDDTHILLESGTDDRIEVE